MSDEIDNKIKEEGNAWIYLIMAIVMLLVVINQCDSVKELENPSNTEISK